MKRFSVFAFAAFAVLAPSLATAQTSTKLVYRPELRQMVAVPQQPGEAPVVTRSVAEEIARHQAMAQGYRGTRIAQSAVHCDRLIKELREAGKAN